MRRVALMLLLSGCSEPEPPVVEGPLGIPLSDNGRIYAGVATVDITPTILETFTDLDDNAEFNGSIDEPGGDPPAAPEPFDDVNGNGMFDAVWMGGFSPMRPATSVADPLSARALVLSYGNEYVRVRVPGPRGGARYADPRRP